MRSTLGSATSSAIAELLGKALRAQRRDEDPLGLRPPVGDLAQRRIDIGRKDRTDRCLQPPLGRSLKWIDRKV
jgi:hypothetical protein